MAITWASWSPRLRHARFFWGTCQVPTDEDEAQGLVYLKLLDAKEPP